MSENGRAEKQGRGRANAQNKADQELLTSADAEESAAVDNEQGAEEPAASTETEEVNPLDDVTVDPATLDAETTAVDFDANQSVEYLPTRRGIKSKQTPEGPESSALLTSDRLLEPKKRRKLPPEGWVQRSVYEGTLHLVNLGDSKKARARKAVDARISKSLEDGGTKFVPVLTRKGGVGKTTITTLLGMALADVREDRIIAIDANPDRGTLAERISARSRHTVRDVVNHAASIKGFTDFTRFVSRDETRLDILASDTDPHLSEAFDENDYNVVADICEKYYSIVLTDCGTGIVHSVMKATLSRADGLVIVSGGSVDEARLASETLTWLEANNYGDLVRNSVVALNTATQGTNIVKLDEIESHFRSRVRDVVRIPYDAQLAAGSVIDYKNIDKVTRDSIRELAALVVEGIA